MISLDLKQGDVLMYRIKDDYLDSLGFILNHVYEVKERRGTFFVIIKNMYVIVDSEQWLMYACDNFKLCNRQPLTSNNIQEGL